MNNTLHKAANCFIISLWGKMVGFVAVLHFPNRSDKKIKRISRLVVLPDYQGIGIGKALLNWVAEYYKTQGFRMILTTSHPAINNSLINPWVLKRRGRIPSFGKNSMLKQFQKTTSIDRLTCSWEYK